MTDDSTPDVQRIARLETSLLGLQQQVSGIGSSVERLASEIRDARRPQWQLMLGVGGMLIMSVGMASSLILFVVTLLISPLSAAQVEHTAQVDRHQDRLDDLRQSSVSQGAALTEVETQFRALSNYRNLTDSHQDRLTALLWRRVYDEDLPGDGERPTVGR